MKLINKILFPVDLSEKSLLMAPYMNMMAEQYCVEYHVIHVVDFTDYYASLERPIPSVKGYVHEIRLWAENKIRNFIDENMSIPPTVTKVVVGCPGDKILDYAESERISLIVMAHSQTLIGRIVFGSVARHVEKRASMPCMIVNPQMLDGRYMKEMLQEFLDDCLTIRSDHQPHMPPTVVEKQRFHAQAN